MDKKCPDNRGEVDLVNCPAIAIVNSSAWLRTHFYLRGYQSMCSRRGTPPQPEELSQVSGQSPEQKRDTGSP